MIQFLSSTWDWRSTVSLKLTVTKHWSKVHDVRNAHQPVQERTLSKRVTLLRIEIEGSKFIPSCALTDGRIVATDQC